MLASMTPDLLPRISTSQILDGFVQFIDLLDCVFL
uniref:Uncharacterized protein n=1 Tax=Trichinella nativa TaxID=6335 RepID=A0A0V1JMV0_9BILA